VVLKPSAWQAAAKHARQNYMQTLSLKDTTRQPQTNKKQTLRLTIALQRQRVAA
jgi:hypothetical protein